jgi:hypothetical protein
MGVVGGAGLLRLGERAPRPDGGPDEVSGTGCVQIHIHTRRRVPAQLTGGRIGSVTRARRGRGSPGCQNCEAETGRLGKLVVVSRLGRKIHLTVCRFCYIQLSAARRSARVR